MKRFLCALLMLCLLPIMAVAEEYQYSTGILSLMLSEYGCPTLPEQYKSKQNNDGTENRSFWLSDHVWIVLKTDGQTISGISVACDDEAETHLFLTTCYISLTVFNVPVGSAAQSVFLQYIDSKTDSKKYPSTHGNNVYSLLNYSPEKNFYTFIIVTMD